MISALAFRASTHPLRVQSQAHTFPIIRPLFNLVPAPQQRQVQTQRHQKTKREERPILPPKATSKEPPKPEKNTQNSIAADKGENKDDAWKNYKPQNPLFVQLHLMGRLIRAVDDLGYKKPTPIQTKVLKPGIKGFNIVASAQTGTGKTAAYLFPALHRFHLTQCKEQALLKLVEEGKVVLPKDTEDSDDPFIKLPVPKPKDKKANDPNDPRNPQWIDPQLYTRKNNQPRVLVLTPTRELAEQVKEHTQWFGKHLNNVRVSAIFGGGTGSNSDTAQISELTRTGVDVLVATPGRLLHLLNEKKGAVDLTKVQCLVIDECDRMLDMGFLPDLLEIRAFLPWRDTEIQPSQARSTLLQVMMFSATLVPRVEDFIKKMAPDHHRCDLNNSLSVAETVHHRIFEVSNTKKTALLIYLLKRKGKLNLKEGQVLIFTRTKQRANRLAEKLEAKGYNALPIHKDKSKAYRLKVIKEFKDGNIKILVATDVMARGIDIPYLPFVVNFDVPNVEQDFVHRIGRTGRAGETGTAITFVARHPQVINVYNRITEINEKHYIRSIEKLVGTKLRFTKVPGPWGTYDPVEETPISVTNGTPIKPRTEDEILEEEMAAEGKTRDATKILERMKMEKVQQLRQKLMAKQIQVKKLAASLQRSRTAPQENEENNSNDTDEAKKVDPQTLIQELGDRIKRKTSLRDFQEGRFEDVVRRFDEKRAVRRGVVLPSEMERRRVLKQKRKKDAKRARRSQGQGWYSRVVTNANKNKEAKVQRKVETIMEGADLD